MKMKKKKKKKKKKKRRRRRRWLGCGRKLQAVGPGMKEMSWRRVARLIEEEAKGKESGGCIIDADPTRPPRISSSG